MSAVCDACGTVQPAGWRAGDLCTSCGRAVRAEQRCGWCARWTPAESFCRHCGAGLVPREHYGAARMLKAAGVDQLSLPERLAALDPAQRDTFTRLYQQQAAVVATVVDDAAFAESFLDRPSWAARLDDELTGTLPLEDPALEALRRPASVPATSAPGPDGDRLRLEALVGATVSTAGARVTAPAAAAAARGTVGQLAALALVRRAWSEPGSAAEALATQAAWDADPVLALTAALALGHWRPRLGVPQDPDRLDRALLDHVLDTLQAAGDDDRAVLARGVLGEPVTLPESIRSSPDADDRFAVALVEGHAATLAGALGDPDRRFAAAAGLARHGEVAQLGPGLAELTDDELWVVLGWLNHHDRPFPTLHDDLMAEAARRPGDVRYAAARIVARSPSPGDALALVRLPPTDRNVIQLVLQRMDLPRPELRAVADKLLALGHLSIDQFGVTDVADGDRLGDDYIPTVWRTVTDEARRRDLLKVAERQLGARGDDDLHRFVLGVAFGDGPIQVRSDAWWVLVRWYGTQQHAWRGPLVLDAAAIDTWFGDLSLFLERVEAFLADPAAQADLALREKVVELLRYATSSGIASVVAATETSRRFPRFVDALAGALHRGEGEISLDLRTAIIRFLELLTTVPEWHDRALAEIDRRATVTSTGAEGVFEASETAIRIRGGRVVG